MAAFRKDGFCRIVSLRALIGFEPTLMSHKRLIPLHQPLPAPQLYRRMDP